MWVVIIPQYYCTDKFYAFNDNYNAKPKCSVGPYIENRYSTTPQAVVK